MKKYFSPKIIKTFPHQLLIINVNFFQFPKTIKFSPHITSFIPIHTIFFPHSTKLSIQQS